jgi:hypothetical protein
MGFRGFPWSYSKCSVGTKNPGCTARFLCRPPENFLRNFRQDGALPLRSKCRHSAAPQTQNPAHTLGISPLQTAWTFHFRAHYFLRFPTPHHASSLPLEGRADVTWESTEQDTPCFFFVLVLRNHRFIELQSSKHRSRWDCCVSDVWPPTITSPRLVLPCSVNCNRIPT